MHSIREEPLFFGDTITFVIRPFQIILKHFRQTPRKRKCQELSVCLLKQIIVMSIHILTMIRVKMNIISIGAHPPQQYYTPYYRTTVPKPYVICYVSTIKKNKFLELEQFTIFTFPFETIVVKTRYTHLLFIIL